MIYPYSFPKYLRIQKEGVRLESMVNLRFPFALHLAAAFFLQWHERLIFIFLYCTEGVFHPLLSKPFTLLFNLIIGKPYFKNF